MVRIRREKKKKFISAILVISVCICGVAIFPGADARAITLEEVRAQRELLQQQKASIMLMLEVPSFIVYLLPRLQALLLKTLLVLTEIYV